MRERDLVTPADGGNWMVVLQRDTSLPLYIFSDYLHPIMHLWAALESHASLLLLHTVCVCVCVCVCV